MSVTPSPSVHSAQYDLSLRRDLSPLHRRYTFAGNVLGTTINEHLEDPFREELKIQLEKRDNSIGDSRKQSIETISEAGEEVQSILGATSQNDETFRTSPEIFRFSHMEEVACRRLSQVLEASSGPGFRQRHSPLLQASSEPGFRLIHSPLLQAPSGPGFRQTNEVPDKVKLEPIFLDKKFVCIEPYIPSHHAGLELEVGDTVQG